MRLLHLITKKVDEARLDLFARKQRAYNAIPPTKRCSETTYNMSNFSSRSCLGSSNCYHATTATSVKLGMAEVERYVDPLLDGVVCYSWKLPGASKVWLQKDFLYRKLQMLPLRSFMHSTLFLQLSKRLLNADMHSFASVRTFPIRIVLCVCLINQQW